MKLSDLITYIDAVKPNAFTDAVKTSWINEVEGMIMSDVMLLSLADIQTYTYIYSSVYTDVGISFPTTETMLLPVRSDFHIGGMVVVADLVTHSANNSATARKILDISADGLTLTFADESFTAGEDLDSAGTLTFDGSATVLMVPAPHDKLYRTYLSAMIDFANGEYDKYNNSMILYNKQYGDFVNWYARTYAPADGEAVENEYYISAYAIAVNNGYEGTEAEWLLTLKGDTGATGAAGADGATGAAGADGLSAFDSAVTGGYSDTESNFYADLAAVEGLAAELAAI